MSEQIRLEQYRICLRDTGLVRQTCCHLEGQLVGVYIVVGAVEQGCTQANHRIAGQNAVLHRLADALVNCRMEVFFRYGTAETLDRNRLGIRRIFHLNAAILTMAAGLLLMLAFYRNSLADLLAVRNDRVGQRNLYARLILQLGAQNVQMSIAGTGDQVLLGFRGETRCRRTTDPLSRRRARPVEIFSSTPFTLGAIACV